MKRAWIFICILLILLSAAVTYAIRAQLEINDIKVQIVDQKQQELKYEIMVLDRDSKEIELQNMQAEYNIMKMELDAHSIINEYLAGYVAAYKSWQEYVEQLMQDNGIAYPLFTYMQLDDTEVDANEN